MKTFFFDDYYLYLAIGTYSWVGILLLVTAVNVEDWLGSEDGTRQPKVSVLAVTFFVCIFASAIQDVAVNGWALTMLQK